MVLFVVVIMVFMLMGLEWKVRVVCVLLLRFVIMMVIFLLVVRCVWDSVSFIVFVVDDV